MDLKSFMKYFRFTSEILKTTKKAQRWKQGNSGKIVVNKLKNVSSFFLFSDVFHIVGNHIMSYADNTMIYADIPRPLSRRQLI